MLTTKTERNGNQILKITKEVDESKPKCWIEGHEYRFNSNIVSIEVVETLKAEPKKQQQQRIEI